MNVMNKWKRISKLLGLLFALYLLVPGLIFNHIRPYPLSEKCETHLQSQALIQSSAEGISILPEQCEDNRLTATVIFKPHAAGPPRHFHEHFDEVFEVKQGVLTLEVNGETKTILPGQKIIVPKGTPHKPFNKTNQEVILQSQDAMMPCTFAYGLAELYPIMDAHGIESKQVLFQLAKMGNGMDTWLADKPLIIQKSLRWILGPSIRIFNP